MSHTGTLYIVATPIGNLEDITLRAIRILKEVGLIAAEDTRHTRKLLNAFDVQTPVVSLHEHNEEKRSLSLILKMKEGLSVAYVSDAGTPGLSDPGFSLIRAALANEISVVPIPGVSAVITALSVSGLPMNRFLFQGFLPAKTARRRQQLAELAMETGTLVFFESPNRLLSALHDVSDIMGNRDVVVCRELTKIYESFFRGPVQETIRALEGQRIKGEVTLLVSGCPEAKPEWSDTTLLQRFEQLRQNPALSRRDCVDRIAAETGVQKSRVYRLTVTE
ncbi:MAG: 16S rRNA (cytidine(1402)-2'-O)-methyltransferase [Deltaproteobacteria bacterium HGW-Deltaproteobacteria-9]|nr:MAG: 16S rRNA (cytidine(1402)-2'-O)-methyltransferase [Deltaproteobacteria bacterium HGW-Deltaproteobacteria-9]